MRPLPLAAVLALWVTGALPNSTPPQAEITVIPEFTSVSSGEVFRVAVQISIPHGYHISWTNPGQTGLPSTIVWEAPPGVAIEDTQWPFPERDDTAGRVSHIYRRMVVAFTRFTVDSSVQARTLRLRGELHVGICGATCRPQREDFDVRLRVRDRSVETTSAWRRIAQSIEKLPVASTGLAVHAVSLGDGVHLTVTGSALNMPLGSAATFFPDSVGAAVVLTVEPLADGIALTVPGHCLATHPNRITGLLVGAQPWIIGSPNRALAIDAMVRDPATEILRGGADLR